MFETLRAFVAVELPDVALAELAGFVQSWQGQRAARVVRWVGREQLHVTVKFLGEISAEKVAVATATLAEVGARHAAFKLRLGRMGVFPNAQRPRVLWVGPLEGEAPLVALATSVEEALAAKGFPREARVPHPHVTLGRVRDTATPAERRTLGEAHLAGSLPALETVRVGELSLMRSTLTPQGARYHVLARLPLSG